MARPKSLSTDELISIAERLRDIGVEEFEFRGLKVKFDPTLRQSHAFVAPPDFEKLNKEQAMDRFRETNEIDDADLEWSV